MFRTLLYNFFYLSFFEKKEEADLILRLNRSKVGALNVSDENCISISVERLKNSEKVRALRSHFLTRSQKNVNGS